MQRILVLLFGLIILPCMTMSPLNARPVTQDTIRIAFDEFVDMATEYSANLDARRKNVNLAENRVQQARANRLLPNLNLTTAHGLVPGVKSMDPSITPGQYYLDPYLENDWEDWGVFTQAEISGIQPIFTWGAISNLINAAQKGVEAARYELDAEKGSYILQLFELYQSALLVNELERLMNQALSQLEEAETELEKMRDEGDPTLEEKDVFEFYIFKAEFETLITEVEETRDFVTRSWNLVLANRPDRLYLPAERFLDPLPVSLQDFGYYENSAMSNRSELKGLNAARQAASYGADAARSQYYPSMVLGLSAGFGYTPNRPRQNNPFIRNNTNFLSARVGFGFQQNLNFWQIRNQVERSEIQKRQIDDFHDAATDGIRIELGDRYRETQIAKSKRQSKEKALRISNEWLRFEQIEFDIGFGDIKNLVDAVKKKMELEVEVTQLTFDLNIKMAKLYRSAGIPLREIMPADN